MRATHIRQLIDELVRYLPLAFRIRQPGRLFADLSQPQVVCPAEFSSPARVGGDRLLHLFRSRCSLSSLSVL